MANNQKLRLWIGGKSVVKTRDGYNPELLYAGLVSESELIDIGSYFDGINGVAINRGNREAVLIVPTSIVGKALQFIWQVIAHGQQQYNGSTTTTFQVPIGITSLFTECWGYGADGANGGIGVGGGGGGGGGYARNDALSVSPGQILNIFIDTTETKIMNSGFTVLVRATAGSVGNSSGAPGIGGSGTDGTLLTSGGNGGTGDSTGGGGGGGAGASGGDGGAGSDGIAGGAGGAGAIGGSFNGGDGGQGGVGSGGGAGGPQAPGGGGGGGGPNSGGAGLGEAGRIWITW